MRYSVVMPVYNKAAYVKESVASALAQPLLHELIIIDDGSTDGSGAICDALASADSRVTVVHQKNSGVSAARNAGIERITGDYACFLDGDDVLCEGFFDKADEILSCGNYDMVFFSFEKTCKNTPSIPFPSPLNGNVTLLDIGKIFYDVQLKTGYFGIVTNKLTKASLLKQEKFDCSLRLAEDFDFWLRIYPKLKAAYFSDFCCFKYENSVEGSSCFDTVDYFSQLKLRIRYKNFLLENRFDFDSTDIEALICRYKFFCLYHSTSCISAAKRLRNEGLLPIGRPLGTTFEKTILFLCSYRISGLAAILVATKKCLGRVKRWIRRK